MQIIWLMHHHENPPLRQAKNKVTDDLIDRNLPELLFYMEEIRGLVRKYSQVLQRYYVQYLSGYDAIALDQSIQNLTQLPEEDSVLLSSICQTISNVSVDQVEDPESNFDFSGLRLDWARLQSYVSSAQVAKPGLLLDAFKQSGIAALLNTIVFHTRMVDQLEEMLVDTSDLSLFCFYARLFEDHFQMCLEFPAIRTLLVTAQDFQTQSFI